MSTWKLRRMQVTMRGQDEVTLPPGWEPLGCEVGEGGRCQLVLGRVLSEDEELARQRLISADRTGEARAS